METKICDKCEEEKQIKDFYKYPNGTYRSKCKKCLNFIGKQYRNSHKEQAKVYRTKIKDKRREYAKKYYQDHKETWPKYKDLTQEQKDLIYQKTYQKHLDRNNKRIAIKYSVQIGEVKRDVVYDRDKGLCHICGNLNPKDNWHLDHIIPLSKGGPHTYENVAVSCPSCNLKKSNHILKESY